MHFHSKAYIDRI